MTTRPFKYLVITFVAVLALQSSAWAQGLTIDMNEIRPLVPIDFLPQDTFEEKTTLFEATPYEDEFLSFQVRLPKGWTESNVEIKSFGLLGNKGTLSDDVLGVVANYVSPAKNYYRSKFNVEAIALEHTMGVRDWFIHYMLKGGLTLQEVGFENDDEINAVYIEVKEDTTYIVRVKVISNGPRMIVARYFLPQELYKEERQIQAQIIDSFTLTNREEVPIEKMEIHSFMGQSFFDYPVSWTKRAPRARSINRIEASIFHSSSEAKLGGKIDVHIVSKSEDTTRGQELKALKDKFLIPNYTFGKLIEKPVLEYHKDMSFGATQAYAMSPTEKNLIDYELWLSILESDKYMYFVTLTTPARKADFYNWARNKASYEVVVKDVRLTDETVHFYEFE